MTSRIGNHDITLDKEFYAKHGLHFHNQYPQDSQACRELFENHPSITYLNHESTTVLLKKENGPRTAFKVFGSPFSPANGLWAFGYPSEKAPKIWEQIPLDTDIVITHTPPKFHCDEAKGRGAVGCEALYQKIWRVRPRLVVCGHVHEGRGAERILWDLESPHVQYRELDTRYWIDPGLGNRKQSLLDLSSTAVLPLDNHDDPNTGNPETQFHTEPDEREQKWCTPWRSRCGFCPSTRDPIRGPRTASDDTPPPLPNHHLLSEKTTSSSSPISAPGPSPTLHLSPPPTADASTNAYQAGFDTSTLTGRMGRKETCIVNAAIMASSWRRGAGHRGKKFNKAVVVDLDLPGW